MVGCGENNAGLQRPLDVRRRSLFPCSCSGLVRSTAGQLLQLRERSSMVPVVGNQVAIYLLIILSLGT